MCYITHLKQKIYKMILFVGTLICVIMDVMHGYPWR